MDVPGGQSSTISQCFVKNICISDVSTGLILFQRVYKWKDSLPIFNLGGLIQVFYQFAREVDDGVLNCVNFESGRKISTRMKNHDNLQARNQTMQMITAKTNDIIVSLFFDMQGMDMPSCEERNKLKVMLHSVIAAFEQEFLETLIKHRPKLLQDLSDDRSTSTDESEPLASLLFVNFNAIVDQLRRQLFPVQDDNTKQDITLNPVMVLEEHVEEQLIQLNASGVLHTIATSINK